MEIPRGAITKTLYSLIKNQKIPEAIEILEQLHDTRPTSRASLSLLAYCHYQLQKYYDAGVYYAKLTQLYPSVPEYQFHLAQCLYNDGLLEEALEATYVLLKADHLSPELAENVRKLQASIHYFRDEGLEAKSLIEAASEPSIDPDYQVGLGCLEYKEGNYIEASRLFDKAQDLLASSEDADAPTPFLWYNRAVAFYQLGDLPSAAHHIANIIENAAVRYPELKMGHQRPEPDDFPTTTSVVGNSRMLGHSALVETLNLKAALEVQLHKVKSAQRSLLQLPPRSEEEVDPITLHNEAIVRDAMGNGAVVKALRKLRFLLEQNTFPPETFANLLILYWQLEQFDLMADLMAVYEEFKFKYLNPQLRKFLESLVRKGSAPEEAVQEMQKLTLDVAKELEEMAQKVAGMQMQVEGEEAGRVCGEYESLVEGTYMPMLLSIGKTYWEKEDLDKVKEVLHQGTEFLSDKDPWILNSAHVVYSEGKDFLEAAGMYEVVVKSHARLQQEKGLLDISAVSLSNLAVCYVLMGRNDEAENLIQRIADQEKELVEEDFFEGKDESQQFHSCIMSLVVGTLYCVKSNYQFGLNKISQALGDFKTENKLSPDTWLYLKMCVLSLLLRVVKMSITVSEDVLDEALVLLRRCEEHGRKVKTVIEVEETKTQAHQRSNMGSAGSIPPPSSSRPGGEENENESVPLNFGHKTVAYEARYLQYLILKVKHEWL